MKERIVNSFVPKDLRAIYYEVKTNTLRRVFVDVVIVKEIRTKTDKIFFELIPMAIGLDGHWKNAEKQLGFLGYAPDDTGNSDWGKIFADKIEELRENFNPDETPFGPEGEEVEKSLDNLDEKPLSD